MEYLVNMTTHVPEGTPETDVQDVRAREAAHSRELAARGVLLRLWRPPLEPGEWRTLGLFAAADDDRINNTLASMPLRIWRTDQVSALAPHPNDPGPSASARQAATDEKTSEFLVSFTEVIPADTPEHAVDAMHDREADRARELAAQGHLLRLWALPAERRALGLFSGHDGDEMQAILTSLPLFDWLTIETTPLNPHPNDPGLTNTTR
ncbi:MAG TPA: muconolactone Delta-isomerase family protein [Ilumatobacteraceae bacterium]